MVTLIFFNRRIRLNIVVSDRLDEEVELSSKSSENVLSKVTDMVSNVYYHNIREMSE